MPVKTKLMAARQLIKEAHYEEARAILQTIDHPIADEWLLKLDNRQIINAASAQISKTTSLNSPINHLHQTPTPNIFAQESVSTPSNPKPQIEVSEKSGCLGCTSNFWLSILVLLFLIYICGNS